MTANPAQKALLLAVGLAAGCHWPGSTPDAGTLIERSTDLHSAIQLIFPEYRGTNVTVGRASITRIIRPYTPADIAAVRKAAEANGFTGQPLLRVPFTEDIEEKDGSLVLTLFLPITASDISRIYAAPASLSSESLAHWLPKPASPNFTESFDLELEWEAARPVRASFLNWQLVDGLINGGWQATLPGEWTHDGGAASVPDPFSLTVTLPNGGATVVVDRNALHDRLHYHLVTRELR